MYSVLLNIDGPKPQRFLLLNPTIHSNPGTDENCKDDNILNFLQLPLRCHIPK
ncbi:unnamed protein product, partial [Larinioides sclopetarius]